MWQSPHLSCKCDQIEMRDYMDRQVTPTKRVTSPTWGPPPPCKQALKIMIDSHCVWVPGIKYQMTTDLKSILLLIHTQTKQSGKEFSSSLEVTGGVIQAPLQSVC